MPSFRDLALFRLIRGTFSVLAISTVFFVMGAPARAQSPATGGVSGRVLDAASGRFLEGAEITTLASALVVTTARDGSFVIAALPVGEHALRVAYPGLLAQALDVRVVAGTVTVLATVRLGADVITLGEFTVSAARQGLSQALALQKASAPSKLVAASDQFGDVSEGNVSEYLKFLPGVGIDYNGNDARAISLRGLSPAFTTVALDGNPMASASSGGESRVFETEQAGINNVETVEVFKTVTPDMRADSTGGQVNLITKSALDRDHAEFRYNLSLTANASHLTLRRVPAWGIERRHASRPSAEFSYSARLGERTAAQFDYRFSEIFHDSPRNAYTWEFRAANGARAIDQPFLASFRIEGQAKITQRQTLGARLDHRFSPRTKLTFGGQWNWYDLTFSPRNLVFATGNTPAYTTSSDVTGRAGAGTITNTTSQRNKYGTTVNFSGKLTHDLAAGSLTAGAFWSQANSRYRDTNKGFHGEWAPTLTGNQISFANIFGGRNPVIAVTRPGFTGDYFRQLANFTLVPNSTSNNFRSRPQSGLDTKRGLTADWRRDLATALPLVLQTGATLDRTTRFIASQNIRVTPGALPASLTGAALDAFRDLTHTGDLAFNFGPVETTDLYKLKVAYPTALGTLSADTIRNIAEDNAAAYARFDFRLRPDLLAIGGVRWERRDLTAAGLNRSTARARNVGSDLSYASWYPSLNLKYTPRANLVVRAAVSRTVGHPDYSDIIPNVTDPDPQTGLGGTLSIPNPKVRPYFVNNYDLSLERYLRASGVVSVAVFRKDTRNFIARLPAVALSALSATLRDEIAADYGIAPAALGGYTVQSAENGAPTRLEGIELSWAQPLAFLPRPFNSLHLQANATKINLASADYRTALAQEINATTAVANLALGWRLGRVNLLATANRTADVLIDTPNSNGIDQLTYLTGRTKIDFRADYAWSKRATLYLQLRNLTGGQRREYLRPLDERYRALRLPLRYFEFGDPIVALGVRGVW